MRDMNHKNREKKERPNKTKGFFVSEEQKEAYEKRQKKIKEEAEKKREEEKKERELARQERKKEREQKKERKSTEAEQEKEVGGVFGLKPKIVEQHDLPDYAWPAGKPWEHNNEK